MIKNNIYIDQTCVSITSHKRSYETLNLSAQTINKCIEMIFSDIYSSEENLCEWEVPFPQDGSCSILPYHTFC